MECLSTGRYQVQPLVRTRSGTAAHIGVTVPLVIHASHEEIAVKLGEAPIPVCQTRPLLRKCGQL